MAEIMLGLFIFVLVMVGPLLASPVVLLVAAYLIAGVDGLLYIGALAGCAAILMFIAWVWISLCDFAGKIFGKIFGKLSSRNKASRRTL